MRTEPAVLTQAAGVQTFTCLEDCSPTHHQDLRVNGTHEHFNFMQKASQTDNLCQVNSEQGKGGET